MIWAEGLAAVKLKHILFDPYHNKKPSYPTQGLSPGSDEMVFIVFCRRCSGTIFLFSIGYDRSYS